MTQPESDLLAIRDQLTRRIWDMNQISLQGPGYAKGYADGLSESLVLLDKVTANDNPLLSNNIKPKLEELRDNLLNFKTSDPDLKALIDQIITSIDSLL